MVLSKHRRTLRTGRMGAATSREPSFFYCSPAPKRDTFLYMGSDVDVSLLRLLQPWETRAVFYDTFLAPGENLPIHPFEAYAKAHRFDSRRSHRETTLPLRPVNNSSARRRLGELVLRRLHDEERNNISDARMLGDAQALRFRFLLNGVRRTLRLYIDNGFVGYLDHLHRLSTYATPGNVPDWKQLLGRARRHHVPSMRILLTEAEFQRAEFQRMGVTITGKAVAEQARLQPARLQGDSAIMALCAVFNYSQRVASTFGSMPRRRHGEARKLHH